jgi:hypothetical protein
MQAKQTHMKRIGFLMLFIALFGVLTTACGVNDFTNNLMTDQQFLSEVSDPQGNANVRGELSREAGVYQNYYDEKTGESISKVKYYANHITDGIKYYGMFIAIPCFVGGFLIRRLVKGSAKIRKIAFVFEIWVPVAWIVLAYLMSFFADKIR